DETEGRRAKGVDLAVQTLEALASERGDGGKIWASVLKEAIKRRKPDFNESYYGFRNFGSLLEEAQSRGMLEVGRDEKANAYVFRSALASQGSPILSALAADSAPRAQNEPREPREARQPRQPRRGRDRHAFEPSVALDASSAPADDDAPARPREEREAQAVVDTLMERPEARDEEVVIADYMSMDEDGAPASSNVDPEPTPRPRRGSRGGRGGRKSGAAVPSAGPGATAPAEPPPPPADVALATASTTTASEAAGDGAPAPRPPRKRSRPAAKKKS
ncbi:MAG TPA: OST-HTH/LOTUS domain-containing protein, partial [Burkholderiaceae bacterium]|nr:OST-HTH/LOTUS domain-containing protein [Burkholderiaceae bacterium]